MAASKFTPENRAALVERAAAGVSLSDACRDIGIREPTVKGWITRGRRGDEGYADFVADLEEAREAAESEAVPMDEAELLLVVSKAARKGSVQAMKLRWEMLQVPSDEDGGETSQSVIDELAQRRRDAPGRSGEESAARPQRDRGHVGRAGS